MINIGSARQLVEQLKSLVRARLPRVLQRVIIARQFRRSVGYRLNISKPQSFNEKLQWLKLYHRDPLITICADKYLVREYVGRVIGEEYLTRLYGTYDHAEDVDFQRLPDRFVLKTNNGSGTNVICTSNSVLDHSATRSKLATWLADRNLYAVSFEWAYRDIEPKIICEELLLPASGADLIDYKIMCFNGKARMVFTCTDRKSSLKVDFFDLNWNHLPFQRKFANNERPVPRPKNLDAMISLAEKLAAPFPFVRVDFYDLDTRIVFGELTFYPGNGMEPFEPVSWDYDLGRELGLPQT